MKRHTETGCRQPALRTPNAFTLIELLVVISIIALLAALMLPVLSKVKVKAQVKKAQLEVSGIAQAIHTYEADYSKFPVSSGVMNAASAVAAPMGPEDFTFGTAGVICVGPSGPVTPMSGGFKTPTGTCPITTPGTGNTQTNNAEVMAILLDVENWPNSPGVPTVNLGHGKNPSKTRYLNANMSGNTSSPGIGTDGIYRDMWGNPYIITIDLNYDDKARDAFYRLQLVSTDADPNNTSNPKRGLNGLIPKVIGGNTVYEANAPVMVWSAGPDKMIDPTKGATVGANRDNILSWK
jgi:prepilin-type N-terminal cleavage/methylation domain-containing protein